jgi:acetyltransferase-like isoleucine patch superfamily enzyme
MNVGLPVLTANLESALGNFKDNGVGNTIVVGANVELTGSITGDDNTIIIGDAPRGTSIKAVINGSRNRVTIGSDSRCRALQLRIGNHIHAHETLFEIGEKFSSEDDCRFLLYNSGNRLTIGNDCMFSNSIIVRCGESPHLIFDNLTGEYLDISEGVHIGHHVWVGERSYITKHCSLPDDCILAACSVATKRFTETHCAIGGNPAKVIRRNVKWIRNRASFDPDSRFLKSYKDANAPYNK